MMQITDKAAKKTNSNVVNISIIFVTIINESK
jgi:hypothetical protein